MEYVQKSLERYHFFTFLPLYMSLIAKLESSSTIFAALSSSSVIVLLQPLNQYLPPHPKGMNHAASEMIVMPPIMIGA